MLERVVVESPAKPNAAVIWCHGLGADGHDFADIFKFLGLPSAHGIRFIFPHAPIMPVSLNQGFRMRSWFDIYALEFNAKQDVPGIRTAASWIETLIHYEIKQYKIDPGKIIVAGFSQGGAVALHVGLRAKTLGGVLGLSTFLTLADTLDSELAESARDRPILMCHGSEDLVVPKEWGEYSRDILLKAGCRQLMWREYAEGHSVNLPELRDIGNWLKQILL